MERLIGDILGWIGTAGTLGAYVLLWRGWLTPGAMRYAMLNAVGGFMASAGALAYGALPAFVSSLLWAFIGVHGVVTAAHRKRLASREARAAVVPPTAETRQQPTTQTIALPTPVGG